MTHTAAIARLHFLLGELYAEAVRETCRRRRVPLHSISLCGMHGQTIFHEGAPVDILAAASPARCRSATPRSWPNAPASGPSPISASAISPPAAMALRWCLCADFLLFRHRRIGRVALNIGGIANITVIPAGAKRDDVLAFDTGPGNMVIDALVSHMTEAARPTIATAASRAAPKVHDRMLASMLADPYFKLRPPKTAGREQFGQEFASGLAATGLPLEALIATATEFTARSVAAAITAYAGNTREVIASGGGVHNRWLMRRLRELLPDFELSHQRRFRHRSRRQGSHRLRRARLRVRHEPPRQPALCHRRPSRRSAWTRHARCARKALPFLVLLRLIVELPHFLPRILR